MVLVVSAFYYSFLGTACTIFLHLEDMPPKPMTNCSYKSKAKSSAVKKNQQYCHWRTVAALNLFYEPKVTFQCVNIEPTQSASECVNPCHLAYQILARNISRDKTKLQICVPWQYICAHLARLIQYIFNRPG